MASRERYLTEGVIDLTNELFDSYVGVNISTGWVQHHEDGLHEGRNRALKLFADHFGVKPVLRDPVNVDCYQFSVNNNDRVIVRHQFDDNAGHRGTSVNYFTDPRHLGATKWSFDVAHRYGTNLVDVLHEPDKNVTEIVYRSLAQSIRNLKNRTTTQQVAPSVDASRRTGHANLTVIKFGRGESD